MFVRQVCASWYKHAQSEPGISQPLVSMQLHHDSIGFIQCRLAHILAVGLSDSASLRLFP